MNANELADGLAKMYIEKDVNGLFNKRIQNMLRQFGLAESIIKQQQLEIEALKLQLHTTLTNRNLRTYDGKTEINNEPVAWMARNELLFSVVEDEIYHIPLYTHPAKTYEDAIEECAQRAEAYAYMSPNFTALAGELRAILRKAQEK